MINEKQGLDFIKFAKKHRSEISDAIEYHIEYLCKHVFAQEGLFSHLRIDELLLKYMRGGKLWRASLVLYWMRIYVGEDVFRIHYTQYMTLAVSMEFLQAFLLIHDDIMDNDDMRRDLPSMHRALSQRLHEVQNTNTVDYQRGGEALAICVGDILYSYVFEMIADNCRKIESSLSQRAQQDGLSLVGIFARYVSIVGVGQMKDVGWAFMPPSDAGGSVDEILSMYEEKTGAYTFVLPSILGLYAATCHHDSLDMGAEMATLDELGRKMGVAFQSRDDIIGATFSAHITGKPQGSDFIEKKQTYVWGGIIVSSECGR